MALWLKQFRHCRGKSDQGHAPLTVRFSAGFYEGHLRVFVLPGVVFRGCTCGEIFYMNSERESKIRVFISEWNKECDSRLQEIRQDLERHQVAQEIWMEQQKRKDQTNG